MCLFCYCSLRKILVFIGTFESVHSKYLDKGPGLWGFIYQVLYSLWAHGSCWEYLLPTSDSTLATVKKYNEKKILQQECRKIFLSLLYYYSFTLDFRSFSSCFDTKKILFWREKEPHSIGLRCWLSPFWLQPFASALVSVNLRDDGTARAGCLFLHRTVFGGGEGKGGGCLHFDAKMIRHAWHYSWLCGWGLGERGSPTETLRPNVTKSDFRKWKVRNAAPATQAHAHPTFMPQQRADPKLWGVGWRMRGQRFLCKMCTLLQYGWGVAEHWPSHVACRAARGPSQRANAGQYMRGGSGGRSVCKSHMLSPCKAAIEVDGDREKGKWC